MNLDQMRKIVTALDVADRGNRLEKGSYFDMEHDILYIPWFERIGLVADMLEAAECHWDEEAESWATF